nr:class I SAM-dependent methyltransferase [Flavilitoribacter nigricans]
MSTIFHDTKLEQKSVLDIGTGTGFFIAWFKDRGADATGIDISPTAVQLLGKQFTDVAFFEADFTETDPIPIQTYDIINAWDVIYHQPEASAFHKFLTNVAAYCKPGGYFICSDGFALPREVSPAPHVKFRNLNVYRNIMAELGFTLRREYPLYKYLNRTVQNNKLMRYIHQTMAPFLFLLDTIQRLPASNNLSVCVWQKEQ